MLDLSRQPAPGSQARGPPESISTRVWKQLSLPSHHGLLLTSRHSKKELSNTSGVTSRCRVGPEGAFKPPGVWLDKPVGLYCAEGWLVILPAPWTMALGGRYKVQDVWSPIIYQVIKAPVPD